MYYTITADKKMLGLRATQLMSNSVEFKAFDEKDFRGAPRISRVEAISPNEIKVYFNQQIKYSTVREDGSNFVIFEQGGGAKYLKINGRQFGDNGKEIILSTDEQKAEQTYILQADKVANAAGTTLGRQDNAMFSGFLPTYNNTELFRMADFNNDGKVDFLDFTIFASFYGKAATDESFAMDLNADGLVDFRDFTLFAANFGSTYDEEAVDDGIPSEYEEYAIPMPPATQPVEETNNE